MPDPAADMSDHGRRWSLSTWAALDGNPGAYKRCLTVRSHPVHPTESFISYLGRGFKLNFEGKLLKPRCLWINVTSYEGFRRFT